MSSLIERADVVARELYAKRIDAPHPLRGWDTLVQAMLAEAFALGALWGLERAQHAVAITHAKYGAELRDEEPQP